MRKIIGCSIGNCIHIMGLLKFLEIAKEENFETFFLGSAIEIEELISKIKEINPEIVAISYRLSKEGAKNLFEELKEKIEFEKIKARFILGTTPEISKIVENLGIFEKIFTGGETSEELKIYLNKINVKISEEEYIPDLLKRIEKKYPHPLLRHHFGLPSLEETVKGIRIISEAKVLDIISIAPDQNAQEFFFTPEKMRKELDGAGGVPLRKQEDLKRIKEASMRGNYPLLRCYAGTNNLIKWGEMLKNTIDNAWAAIPIFWYSVLDKRSKRELKEAILENQAAISWHAERNIPVEINESHQWSLRGAPDQVAVAISYISAYNAKKLGVKNYISQYMFNTPNLINGKMDLGKMLAKKTLIESLQDENFNVFNQCRAGLSHFLQNLNMAKGQLSASCVLSLSLKPHIYHVVGYSEAHHTITPEELIESCEIVKGVIKNVLDGFPDFTLDPEVKKRKEELIEEAILLIEGIKKLGNSKEDPLTSPSVLKKAVEIGLLDAPDLKGNKYARGEVKTKIIEGKCVAVDENGNILKEKERIKRILEKI
jgi:hypothetical protein